MTVYVGIGSNLGDSKAQVLSGVEALKRLDQTEVIACSSLYHTKPMGPQDQPDYINAVVQCRTKLAPLNFLQALLSIEHQHGRVRDGIRFGPRTLDLDILLFDDVVMQSEQLCIPHPGVTSRAFVLYPLAELAPDLIFPDGKTLSSYLTVVSSDGIHQLTQKEAL